MSNQTFPNVGFLADKLSENTIKRLQTYIRHKKKKTNNTLAGNITNSFILEDKNDFFFTETLLPAIDSFQKTFNYTPTPALTKDCKFKLDRFWVNFQHKYEFNPVHNHSGIYSFVVWMKIPSSYKEESKLPFTKHSNSICPNTFQFLFIDTLGKIKRHDYYLDPSYEGTMLFFPAQLNHCVYPFYLSNKPRISISGNIFLDPSQIMENQLIYKKIKR